MKDCIAFLLSFMVIGATIKFRIIDGSAPAALVFLSITAVVVIAITHSECIKMIRKLK